MQTSQENKDFKRENKKLKKGKKNLADLLENFKPKRNDFVRSYDDLEVMGSCVVLAAQRIANALDEKIPLLCMIRSTSHFYKTSSAIQS